MKEATLMTVAVAAAAAALAGCSGAPEGTPAPVESTKTTATQAEELVALVPASAETTKATRITQWRVMRNGSDSTTYGVDASGNVISHIATVTAVKNGQPDGVEVRAILPESGALRLSANAEVLGSTLTQANAAMLGRQGADLKAYQEAGGEVAYDMCGWAIFGAAMTCGWGATGCVVAGVVTFGASCFFGGGACIAAGGVAYATC